jgi:hypothetical protein
MAGGRAFAEARMSGADYGWERAVRCRCFDVTRETSGRAGVPWPALVRRVGDIDLAHRLT